MKLTEDRPYANPEAAARKLVEIANAVEAVQDGRIHIELLNGPMLFELKATPAEYSAGLKLTIERGSRCMRAALMCGSPRPARSCSPKRGRQLRRPDAFYERRREGPYRFIQNRSRTSLVALTSDAAAEKSKDQLSRDF